jgi:ribonuclease D
MSRGERVVGFDSEWAVQRERSATHLRVALIQVATEKECLVFSAEHLGRRGEELPRGLAEMLSTPKVIKAGVGIAQDQRYLERQFSLKLNGLTDLAHVAAEKLHVGRSIGTRRLAAELLHVHLTKDKQVAVSRWEAWPLSPSQIEYAAADALVAWRMAKALGL